MILYRSSDEWVSTATRVREFDHGCGEISEQRGGALHDALRGLVIDLGVLVRLLQHFRVPVAAAAYVGDQQCDAEAARGTGIPFRWASDLFDWRADVSG